LPEKRRPYFQVSDQTGKALSFEITYGVTYLNVSKFSFFRKGVNGVLKEKHAAVCE